MKKLISLFLLIGFVATSVFAQVRETRSVGTFTKIAFRVPGKLYLRQGTTQKVEIEGKKEVLEEIETKLDGNKLVIGKEGHWDWSWGNDDKVNVYITVKDIEALSVGGSGDLIAETKITSSQLDLNVSGSGSLKAEVEVTGALDADVSGSGEIEVRGKCKSYSSSVSGSGGVILVLNITDVAEFGVSGSGKIQASGTASRVKASISGSGRVLAANLETNVCDVRISGSGDVEINVKEELDANISGSGSVSYKGDPKKLNSHSAGSGKVRKM
ncbi:MAG TPA: head GIN domain-containing protein [Ohtaekwangia sp.]